MIIKGIDTSDLKLTMQDLAECNLCARGSKRFLEKRGICFRTFLKEGLPLDRVIAWNDGSSNKVVEHILRKYGHEG
ncbi:hypothetical protein [Nitrosomonas sp. Nm58]|uniref:hypothetical protein n=1 Tax=Nitrosomonas sp. Nm58 TaxID=200126 RepID=UPI00089AA0D1|nr:hypothetical protein [Nitrosomonas sp. Nm58]SDY23711.1 hypothetical protein SAMN05421754_100466 [Nitrosomonas sp. Nm58]